METKEKLIKAIVEALDHLPEKYLRKVHDIIHNFRTEISPEENDLDRGEKIDEIHKVQEQIDQIRPDKFGGYDIT